MIIIKSVTYVPGSDGKGKRAVLSKVKIEGGAEGANQLLSIASSERGELGFLGCHCEGEERPKQSLEKNEIASFYSQ